MASENSSTAMNSVSSAEHNTPTPVVEQSAPTTPAAFEPDQQSPQQHQDQSQIATAGTRVIPSNRDPFHIDFYDAKKHDPDGWNHGLTPRWSFDPAPTFKPSYLVDVAVVPCMTKFHQSLAFVLLVELLLFGGFILKIMSYNWAWPSGMGAFGSTTYERGTALFLVGCFTSLSGYLLVLSAMNRQLLGTLLKTFDFIFFSGNLLLLGIYNAYDEYSSQTSVISGAALWLGPMLVYGVGGCVIFAGDALTSTHGGRRLRGAVIVFGLMWFAFEVVSWRWFRAVRDEVIQLPFLQATVGSLASTNTLNHLFVSVKNLIQVCWSRNTMHMIGVPLTYTNLKGLPLEKGEEEKKAEEAQEGNEDESLSEKKKEKKKEKERKKKEKEKKKKEKESVQPYPITWRLDVFEFQRRWVADVVVFNGESMKKFHLTPFFALFAIFPMFTATGMQFLAYDWDFPDWIGWMRNDSEDQVRGTLLYAAAYTMFLIGNGLLFSTFNRQMLALEVGASVNAIALMIGTIVILSFDCYDVMATQGHVVVPWFAWYAMFSVPLAALSMFGGDAFSPCRIGTPTRLFFFVISASFMGVEVLMFRWFRLSRDVVIQLPFFQATIGGIVVSLAANQAIYSAKLLVQSVLATKDKNIFVLSGKMDVIAVDPEVEENLYQERLQKWSPSGLTMEALVSYTAQHQDEHTVHLGDQVTVIGPAHELGWYYVECESYAEVSRPFFSEEEQVDEAEEEEQEEEGIVTEGAAPLLDTRLANRFSEFSPERVAPKRLGKGNACWGEKELKALATDAKGHDHSEPFTIGEDQDEKVREGPYRMLPLAFLKPLLEFQEEHLALSNPKRKRQLQSSATPPIAAACAGSAVGREAAFSQEGVALDADGEGVKVLQSETSGEKNKTEGEPATGKNEPHHSSSSVPSTRSPARPHHDWPVSPGPPKNTSTVVPTTISPIFNLPEGKWDTTDDPEFFWSEAEQLYFHAGYGHFFDPESEQFYDPETEEWYTEEEVDL